MIRRIALLVLLSAGLIFAAEHSPIEREDSSGVLFWKTLNFVILATGLVWATKKYGGPYFRRRTERIQQEIADAHRVKEEAGARAAEMQQRLDNLEQDIVRLRESAKAELEAEEARLKAATERAVGRLRASAEQEITAATRQARRELKGFAGELALELARQKVKDRMTPETASRLVEAFVEELPRRRN